MFVRRVELAWGKRQLSRVESCVNKKFRFCRWERNETNVDGILLAFPCYDSRRKRKRTSFKELKNRLFFLISGQVKNPFSLFYLVRKIIDIPSECMKLNLSRWLLENTKIFSLSLSILIRSEVRRLIPQIKEERAWESGCESPFSADKFAGKVLSQKAVGRRTN